MDKKLPLALKVNDLDNVATVFSNEAVAGSRVEVRDKKGNASFLTVVFVSWIISPRYFVLRVMASSSGSACTLNSTEE